MAIVEDAFYVPEEIMAGLSAGTLVRYGGVVRNLNGEIVKHLDPVHIPQKAKIPTGVKIAAVGLGAIALAGTGYGIYKLVQHVKTNSNINTELYTYLQAAKEGNITKEHIQSVLDALQEAKKKKVKIYVTKENINEIIETITMELANSNSLIVKEEALKLLKKETGEEKLTHLFNIQNEIFQRVA